MSVNDRGAKIVFEIQLNFSCEITPIMHVLRMKKSKGFNDFYLSDSDSKIFYSMK